VEVGDGKILEAAETAERIKDIATAATGQVKPSA